MAKDFQPCENFEDCRFFNQKLERGPVAIDAFRSVYCMGDFNACARYRVAMEVGRENVPDNLYPNNSFRAQRIVALEKRVTCS